MKIAFVVPDNRDEFGQFDLPAPIFGPAPQALLDGFAQIPECEIHLLSTSRRQVACPEKIASNIFLHSLVVSRFGRLRTLNAGATLAIRSFLQRIQPEVVHGQGSERYPAIAAAYSGFPNVITIHGIMSKVVEIEKLRPLSFLGITAALERRALRRTNSVICLTNHAKNIIENFNPQVFVIPNAIPDRFFQIPRNPSVAIEIICPAHIYRLKNQIGLIEALDSLAARIPFKLTLLGKLIGDEASGKVQQLAASRPWCQLAGMADSAGLANALSRATLLVLPSFEENCPMAILEGMAVGIPIAASRAGGIPDLVQHEVTGLLFDPHQPESIRSAIERMLTNPELAQKLAAAGRKRAEADFRPKAIAARHLEVYSRLVRKSLKTD
jgi:glycosyltransferase involved in cell wall biosynthesis